MKIIKFPMLAIITLFFGCAPETPQATKMANVKQVMNAVVEPAAEVYWDAVGTIVDENGIHEFAPSTPAEWQLVRNAAVVLAESGDLLMIESRALDQDAWKNLSNAMNEAGSRALEAAHAQDPVAVFDAGAEVYFACSKCHATYAPEIIRPSDIPEE